MNLEENIKKQIKHITLFEEPETNEAKELRSKIVLKYLWLLLTIPGYIFLDFLFLILATN